MMAGRLEDKSVDDVCGWLEGKGFSDSVLDIFKGNGNAGRSVHSFMYIYIYMQKKSWMEMPLLWDWHLRLEQTGLRTLCLCSV